MADTHSIGDAQLLASIPLVILTTLLPCRPQQDQGCSTSSRISSSSNSSSTASSLGQRLASTAAGTLMGLATLSGVASDSALASEFDLLAEPKPDTTYYVDDAGALSKSTKGDLNKKLKELEV